MGAGHATSSDVDKLASAGSNTQLYSPLSDPSNTGSWVYQTDLSDEFNGDSFDRSVWHNMGEDGDYKGQWKGRAPSQYNPENIRVENGNL